MQTLNRTGNTKRNIIWAFINKFVGLAGPFVVRVLLIRNLGAEYLGLSGLYLSILTVLSLAELGFATAVSYCMYKPVAEGNTEEVARYLNYFKYVYRWVGIAIFTMGLCLLPFIDAFMKDPAPAGVNVYLGFFIYLINSSVSYLLFAYKQSLLISHQRNDIMNKVNIFVLLTQFTMQSVLLVVTPNFYLYAVVLPLTTVMMNLLINQAVNKLLPEYGDAALRTLKLSAADRAALRKRVGALLLTQICVVTRYAFGRIFIASAVGLVAVAAYDNYFVVFSGVVGIMAVFVSAMTPAAGNSVATESKEKNFADLRLFMFLYAGITTVLAACMLALYQPFIVIWVGEELLLPLAVPILLTMYLYFTGMGDMLYVYVNASGIWWGQRWRAVVESVANFVLNFALVQVLGVPGAVLGTVISLFFINFLWGGRLAFRDYFGLDKVNVYYADHALYLGVAAVICVATFFVCGLLPDGGVWLWLAKAAVALVVSGGLFLVLFGWTKRFRGAVPFVLRVLRARVGGKGNAR